MTFVGSVEIAVDLQDDKYQRKKREYEKWISDLNNYPNPLDVRPFLSTIRRAQDGIRSVRDGISDLFNNNDLKKIDQNYSLVTNPLGTLLREGVIDVVRTLEARSQKQYIKDRLKDEQDLEQLRSQQSDSPQRDTSLGGRVGQLPSAGSVVKPPVVKPSEPSQSQNLSLDRASVAEAQTRFEISVALNDLDAQRSLARLSSVYGSAKVTQAQYEQESYEISQIASSKRLAIAQQESVRLASELGRLGVPVETKRTASPFFVTRNILQDPATLNLAQAQLAQKLIALENQSAKDVIEIEQSRIKRQNQLRQEQFDYYKAASKSVADVVVTGIEAEIGASNRRLAAFSITNEQLKLTRSAFEQQSTAQRTAIGLMEQYADVALRQSKELQNLSALSKTTVGSTPLVRREIVTQLTELTGKSNFADLRLPGLNADQSLLVRRQQQEDEIAQTQTAALDAQLNQKRLGLQLDIQSQAIAQARAEQEARVTLLKAQQNKVTARQQLFEAELAVETLPSNATERDRIVARNRFNNAQAQFNLVDQGVGLATNALNATGVYAQIQQQISKRILADFGVEANATRELFNLKDAARERGQSLELATQGIDPRRFNRRLPGLEVGDRTQLLTGLDRSGGVLQNQAAVVGIGQLVTIAQQTYLQNRQMLSELQVIATRSPITLVGNGPAPSRVLRDNKL